MKISTMTAAAAYLSLAAIALPAQAADKASAFDSSERKEIESIVREYLLVNPDVLTEMVDALQAKQEAEQAAAQKAVLAERHGELFEPAEETIIGNPKGDVTVVEFFDYNCGYCKSMFPSVMSLLNEDGNIRLVLKELPILGPSSETASKAALASRKQGKYSEFHQALLGHRGGLNDDAIFTVAASVGLNVPQLRADMKDKAIEEVIDRNRALARELQVTGTPAVLVGETFFPGAISKERLQAAVEDARS
ncbi:MAG: DsbA family protein [Rhodobacteraceae bacterium]|nr:DsbA family protein [Paracoccaceae bacterium]